MGRGFCRDEVGLGWVFLVWCFEWLELGLGVWSMFVWEIFGLGISV